ncbi:MAG: cyclic pyranopterin monophosphate synthase MoaC [Actinomycetota bacterium]
MKKISHINSEGKAKMVDVSTKPITHRVAKAQGKIWMSNEMLHMIKDLEIKKGDVLAVAKIAGIMAAKKTHELIPLCHPLSITDIKMEFELKRKDKNSYITCSSEVKCDGKTGAEMEALISTSISLLTIYDMCKGIDRDMIIGDIKLIEKSGGKSGKWKRK